MSLFPGFRSKKVRTSGATINLVIGGNGPPVLARDMAEVMASLGFLGFHVVGHDRGGRVAHRLARDYPRRIRTLTMLDISPTLK